MATTNGTNGHTNGHTEKVPATALLAAFVANANTNQLTPVIREKAKEVLLDYIGVVIGALDNSSSSEPIYNSILALQGGPSKHTPCTVLGKGAPHMLPQYAGLLNSAFGHSMDFDDTHVEGPLHPGITAISAAMTQAELLGMKTTTDEFILAMCIAYEITCRLGRELDYATYDRGFHLTSIAGIFGAVAAIAVLKKLDAHTVEMAWGLAGSKAGGTMQYLDNGSWNKRLQVGFAVHDAFMCVALAEGGVIGATRIFEGDMGFLHAYSPKPNKDMKRMTADLGTDWLWLATSLKPYPACRMTHCFIELAGNLHEARKGKVDADAIQSIEITMPKASIILVGQPTPNKIHPTNAIDAQFSAYFQTANGLVYGSATGMKAYNRLQDPEIHAICDKIKARPDESLFGFAADIVVHWTDGTSDHVKQQFPLGEVQHPFTKDRVDEKFMSLAGPAYGESRALKIIEAVNRMEDIQIEELLVLMR